MGRLFSTLIFAMSVAIAAGANTDNLALCDGIAARLRSDPALTAGASPDDPLTALSTGSAPYLDLVRRPVLEVVAATDADRTGFLDRFKSAFGPSGVLTDAVARLAASRQNEVFALPSSSLHVVVTTRGALNCQTLLFFRTEAGKPAEIAPRVSGTDDPICYNTSGHLARVAGTEAYVEFVAAVTNYRYALSVVPWRGGTWAEGCSVAADFKSSYRTSQTFVRPNGPIEHAAIRELARELVAAWSSAENSERFEFGPKWPDFLSGRARELQALGSAHGTTPVPTFGAPMATLGPFYQELEDPDAYPIFFGGQVYLAQVGHATIGFRMFQDSLVILHTLKDGRLLPVASAVVEQDQGPLESVRVTSR